MDYDHRFANGIMIQGENEIPFVFRGTWEYIRRCVKDILQHANTLSFLLVVDWLCDVIIFSNDETAVFGSATSP